MELWNWNYGVLLGENLTWKPHIKYAKKKKNYEKYWIII